MTETEIRSINQDDAQRVLEELENGFNAGPWQWLTCGQHQEFIQRYIYGAAVEYLRNGYDDPYEALSNFNGNVPAEVWELIFDESDMATQEGLIFAIMPLDIAHDRGRCTRVAATSAAIDHIRAAVKNTVGIDPASFDDAYVELENDCVTIRQWRAAFDALEEAMPRVPTDVTS